MQNVTHVNTLQISAVTFTYDGVVTRNDTPVHSTKGTTA